MTAFPSALLVPRGFHCTDPRRCIQRATRSTTKIARIPRTSRSR
jgi:hypothetical protein